MGNVLEGSESDEDVTRNEKNDEDIIENDVDTEKAGQHVGDLSSLFDHSALRTAASKIRDNLPNNADNTIQQHQAAILRWLDEARRRNEDTVTLDQFCDLLTSRSVSREEAYQAFQQFDTDGEDVADVSVMRDAMKSTTPTNLRGELNYVIRTLQSCSLTPGFLDVYIKNPQGIGQHGARILNFLLRNRAASSSLSFPLLDGFNNTSAMRLTVLKSVFKKLCASEELVLDTTVLSEGEEVKPVAVAKCYTSITVSSNPEHAGYLTDSSATTFWQSDGSARSHFIRIKMKPGVVVKQLHIGVCSDDQSYMPQLVVVSAGKNAFNLRQIKEKAIPGFVTGDVLLVENLTQHYPYISLNIRRCHNDGCDTRIHGLKIMGYKIVRESKFSVMDASAVWYLQVLGSTITASIPITPHLRSTIIEHTRNALRHIGPLMLTPYSGEKPAILSGHVLNEINRILQDITCSGDQLMPEGLYILLGFSLARGHILSILSTLKTLQDNPEMSIKGVTLLKSLTSVRESFQRKLGGPLQMTLLGCDGGCKAEGPKPESVLTSSMATAGTPYISGDGKTMVNMLFKVDDGFVQLSKIKIKVGKGPKGAKCGLVFVFNDSEGGEMERLLERFKQYDEWSDKDSRLSDDEKKSIAYFQTEDEWDEAEVFFQGIPCGKYILVKFLKPRDSSADQIAIEEIKFYGFTHALLHLSYEDLVQAAPIPTDDTCSAQMVFLHTLFFLVELSREQSPQKISDARAQALDTSDLTLQSVWQLFNKEMEGECTDLCRQLVLSLLHSLLQHFDVTKSAEDDVSQEIFGHLCHLVDTGEQDDTAVKLAKQIIIDGAVVFFPDKEARRKQLFNMMSTANAVQQSQSTSLIFQSLCQFFSSVDPSSLLNLPQDAAEEFDEDSVLHVMDTLICVAGQEFSLFLSGDPPTQEKPTPLVLLLNSLQTSLLVWCKKRLALLNKAVAESLLLKYCVLVTNKATEACKLFRTAELGKEEREEVMKKLETTFLSTVVRQMILCQTDLCDKMDCSTKVQMARMLTPMLTELQQTSLLLPGLFYTVDSDLWRGMQADDVVLRVWEEESPHNYHNNQHTTKVFCCPGASLFIVEFDARCETEKRYDYLEFTDSFGVKTRYDQTVCTEKWPKIVQFKGGHRLQFLFHSDSSNNEWGYKFKVTAKGCPDVPLCWMFDFQLGLSKLYGRICGSVLSVQKAKPTTFEPGSEEETQAQLLKSDLWTTLFRGGFMVHELQRSLSGIHETEVTNSGVNHFLQDMIEGREGRGTELITKLKEQSNTANMGGVEVDEAVKLLFAALVWHTQPLREEMEVYAKGDCKSEICEGIQQAYTVAETLRLYLIEAKQKIIVAEEKGDVQDPLKLDPVTACKDKAMFLLQFAGLNKVELKPERVSRAVKLSKSRLHKRVSAELDKGYKFDSMLSEKYPAFKLVMEFVRNPLWSKDKVSLCLQERSKLAGAVADVYVFAAEFINICKTSHIFQVPSVVFLQELLANQHLFAKHYADMLDGCGLSLESKVRQAYYGLIRCLRESVKTFSRPSDPGSVGVASTFDYILIALLHLLDMDWQLYDLTFLLDIDLPSLLFWIAQNTVTMRDESVEKENDEALELAEYEQCLKWFEECRHGFSTWFNKINTSNVDEKRAKQMFVARFSDLLDVEINCDGCDATLPGPRYRCLQCEDKDLCSSCYMGGVTPGGEHTEDHEFVHLMYKCDECRAFIAGTRFHCTMCEDYDLCLGCHNKKSSSNGHTSDHGTIKFPQVKLKSSNKVDSDLQAYIHQHVWLQFSSLTLTMAGLAYSCERGSEYTASAVQLLNHCLMLVTECLQHEPGKKQAETEAMQEDMSEKVMLQQEEAFALHSQEKIMGLLGAAIPGDNTDIVEGLENGFEKHEFLMLLLRIIRGDTGHEVITQHMAMGLIVRLLQRFTHADSIRAFKVTLSPASPTKTKASQSYAVELGEHHLRFLGQVKDYFTDKPEVQLEFFHNIAQFKAGTMDASKVKANSMSILEDQPELLESFDAFINDQSKDGTTVQEDQVPVEVDNVVQQEVTEEQEEKNIVDFLFSFGAMCLERSGLEWACSVAQILQQLLAAPAWKDLLLEHINQSVMTLKDDPELSAIFALFVLAGYPEVLSVGVGVKYSLKPGDSKHAVVLKHFTDKHRSILVDCKTRRRQTVTDGCIEVNWCETLVLKEGHVSMFISTVRDIIARMKSGTPLSVETLWVLSLCLKCLLKSGDFTEAHCKDLFAAQFIQSLVCVSKQGTGFSKQWLLKDLEILSLMLYSRDKDAVSNSVKVRDVTLMPKDLDSSKDLDDMAKICFETLHEKFNIPMSILRAIYELHGQSTDDLLLMVRENLFDGHYRPSDSIRELAKKWEAGTANVSVERVIDTGVMEINSSDVPASDVQSIECAAEEASDVTQKLIAAEDAIQQRQMKRKSESAQLLKEELEDQGKAGSKEYLTKVNNAMSVLYARQILLSLLADWPESHHPITAELLGCQDTRNIPCVLDILNTSQNKDLFQKVIKNVIHHCCHDDLAAIVDTACQFLREVNLETVTKESEHNYKNNAEIKDKVHLPGASYLSIKFDSKCSTEQGCDQLVMASTEDLHTDRRVFSGTGDDSWRDFEVQGNTLYYMFTSDRTNNDWGFRFTVSGGWMGRFDTGYLILREVLEKLITIGPLHIENIWHKLVYIASQQTGTQRLKTIELLLRLIQAELRQQTQQASFDLTLLRPLWKLYSNLSSASVDKASIALSVVRALTELFVLAENLAVQWNLVHEYVASLHSSELVAAAMMQGVRNIAILGLSISQPNKASKTLLAAIRKASKQTTVSSEAAVKDRPPKYALPSVISMLL